LPINLKNGQFLIFEFKYFSHFGRWETTRRLHSPLPFSYCQQVFKVKKMENSLDKKYITILRLKILKPSTCDWLLSLQTDPLLYRIDLNRNLIFKKLVEFCHMKATTKTRSDFFWKFKLLPNKMYNSHMTWPSFKNDIIWIHANMLTFYKMQSCFKGSS
jgi:hypothetical protein